jgi:hypothetical protein
MHGPQFVGHIVRLTYFEGLALGLVVLVFGGVAGLIAYLERRRGVNPLISFVSVGVIVAFVVFLLRWPR